MTDFDPNSAAAKDSGIFGLPYSESESELIIIPVPWDATASCLSGTSSAPKAIAEASKYVELFDPIFKTAYEKGVFMTDAILVIANNNDKARKLHNSNKAGATGKINDLCEQLNETIESTVNKYLSSDKKVGLIGGDHSIAYGSIKAHLSKYPDLSVLQFDAHADLRASFENFTYSHASVFYNVVEKLNLKSLTQVGVRGLCQDEFDRINDSPQVIKTFFQSVLDKEIATGRPWEKICDDIINTLNSRIYISFDIDVLSPDNCPNTGTPVPGGITFNQAVFLLRKIRESGKTIVGFDLVEVRSDNQEDPYGFDYVIGAHLLYQLSGYTLSSQCSN